MLPELPPKRNTPPRIVGWTPQQRGPYFSSTGCTNTAFAVTVVDEDVTDTGQRDTLRSYWFIDDIDATAFQVTVFPTASATRVVPAPTARFITDLSNLSAGAHQVRVFVTDGDFDELGGGNVTANRPPVMLADGGTIADIAYIDSFSWFIEVQPCP